MERDETFKTGKDIRSRFLFDTWKKARLGDTLKKWVRAKFYFSCNCSCTVSFFSEFIG